MRLNRLAALLAVACMPVDVSPCFAQNQRSVPGAPASATNSAGEQGGVAGCPAPPPVTAVCAPTSTSPAILIDSVPFAGDQPLGITIRSDGGGAATIWVPGLYDGKTYQYDENLVFQGSFFSPTGIFTTTGIAYDPVNQTLWYVNSDLLEIVESDVSGNPTGNVITCVPTANGIGLPAGLCYHPEGDDGNGTFIYNDIVEDDVFEVTRLGELVRQIPKSCADDGLNADFGNGLDCNCSGIEVLVGPASAGQTERAVLINPLTGVDAGASTDLTGLGDTFINGLARHPDMSNSIMYVVGNATNTLFIVDPANVVCGCPQDLTGDSEVNAADLASLLGAWGSYAPCPPYLPQDLTQDCAVNAADLASLLGAWGPCPGTGLVDLYLDPAQFFPAAEEAGKTQKLYWNFDPNDQAAASFVTLDDPLDISTHDLDPDDPWTNATGADLWPPEVDNIRFVANLTPGGPLNPVGADALVFANPGSVPDIDSNFLGPNSPNNSLNIVSGPPAGDNHTAIAVELVATSGGPPGVAVMYVVRVYDKSDVEIGSFEIDAVTGEKTFAGFLTGNSKSTIGRIDIESISPAAPYEGISAIWAYAQVKP